jgi:imidazolonepropionase-like amidohydrolase
MRGLSCFLVAFAACGCSTLPAVDTLEVRHATVIDPASGTVAPDRCVRISGDTITGITDCAPVPDTPVIDARGRWVIPGLWDMHVHAVWHEDVYEAFFDEFIRFGVVGIRDMGGDLDVLQQARWHLAQPGAIGPYLVAPGPFLDGPEAINPSLSIPLESYKDGVNAVRRIAARGADFVKLYTLLPREAALGAMAEAKRQGLPVVGHLPASLDLDTALRHGMSGIEHMAVEIGGLCDVNDRGDPCAAVFDRLKKAGVSLTPTLIVRERRTQLDLPGILELARVDEMPEIVADDWLARREHELDTLEARDWKVRRAQFVRERALTTRAIREGALVLAGTDAGDLFVTPGESLHDELALLVEAGMSEMQALRAATSDATAVLGLSDRGVIRKGARADLVILRSDPLFDINNTRDIETVVVSGMLVPPGRPAHTRPAPARLPR